MKKLDSIDPITRFFHLFVLAIRENDITSYVFYRLSSYPASRFKIGIKRDPKKKLREYLTKNVNQTGLPGKGVYVINRGALLHLVQWLSNTNYSGVTKLSQIVIVNLNKKVNTSQKKFLKMVKTK